MSFASYPGSQGAATAAPGFASYPGTSDAGFGGYPTDPRGGIVSNIVREFGRDLKGGFNVANATIGEFSALLGFAAPVTYDDLTTRDIKGAMMLAALGVGGWVSGVARGIPAIQAMTGGGAIGRATGTAMAEAISGAAVGMIRPLEDDEERMSAVFGDAVWAGGFGAGFSFARSAWKATLGGRIAAIKQQSAMVRFGQALKNSESEDFVRESAGLVLLNPDTNARLTVRRLEDGTIQRTLIDSSGAATTAAGTDFGATLASAVQDGFTESLGVNRKQFQRSLSGKIDVATLDKLKGAEFDISAALGPVRMQEYAAVRMAAQDLQAAGRELGSLAGEVLAPTKGLGVPSLTANARATLLKELKLDPKLSDGDVLRAGFRAGLVDVDVAKAGIDLDRYAKDLFLSDMVPQVPIVVSNHMDAVGTSLLLPRRLAKMFPAFAPIYADADSRLTKLDDSRQIFDQWLSGLRQTVPLPKAKLAVEIIDKSADEATDAASARLAAIAAAQATGDQQIITFVEQATGKLGEYLTKAQQAGILDEGISGYFPMLVANKWKLDVDGISKEALADTGVKLFYPKKAEAEAAAKQLVAKGLATNYTVSPQSFWHPEEIFSNGPEGVAKLEAGYKRAFGKPPLKSTPFAKQRTLGIRDFSEDPYTALEVYGASMERALALRDFERTARPLIDAIPESQHKLRRAAEQYVDDIMGRPRDSERTFQAVLEHVGYDAPPRALKKYVSAIRKWEAFSRLSGPFSAIINLTQVALNTVPVLGVKDTARGLEPLTSPAAFKRVQETLRRNGLNLGHFVPFSDTGDMVAAFGGPRAALKEKRYVEALHRMSLSLFYGAEKTNRLVTAWGAFKQGMDKFGDEKLAAGFAQEVLERTQFNYRLSNTPDFLRSPVGALLFQFKSFVINEVEFIASLNKQEALRFGAAVWALGGMSLFMNMPGTDIVNAASTMFFDRKLDEAMALSADEGLAQRGLYFGLAGFANIDMSDYVGLGMVNEITNGVFGPATSDAKHLYEFLKNAAIDIKSNGFISTGTSTAFVQQASPAAIRRAMRGYDIFSTGEVRNPYTNKLVYRPANRLRAAVQQTVGFPELEMTQQRAADAITTRVRDSYLKGRTTFAKEAAQAIREGRPDEAQRVISEAKASGFDLDQRTIRYWTKEMGATADERRMRRTPAQLRAEYTELFETTGTLEL